MRKGNEESPSRVVRDLLENVTYLQPTIITSRAHQQVMRAIQELEMMGSGQGPDGEYELVELEYDKFRPRVRPR